MHIMDIGNNSFIFLLLNNIYLKKFNSIFLDKKIKYYTILMETNVPAHMTLIKRCSTQKLMKSFVKKFCQQSHLPESSVAIIKDNEKIYLSYCLNGSIETLSLKFNKCGLKLFDKGYDIKILSYNSYNSYNSYISYNSYNSYSDCSC